MAGCRRWTFRVEAGAHGGQHRGAARRGLDVLGPADREAGRVGAELPDERRPRAAGDADEALGREPRGADGLHDVAKCIGRALQERAARCARPCAGVRPYQPPRASASHTGAIAPPIQGRKTTPSLPGGTVAARRFSSS